jgi:acyl-CoA synthetase (AMP-forming)/AMP-acid ligase II
LEPQPTGATTGGHRDEHRPGDSTVNRESLGATLHEALDRVASAHPEQVLRFHSENETLTYAELATASRRGAARLAAAGVAPGDAVAVLAPNAPEFVAGVFAATRTGAAACPLPLPAGLRDLAGYVERTARIVATAGVTHLVLSHRLARPLGTRVALLGVPHVLVSDALLAPGACGEMPVVDPAGPAVLQFTSGSTAAPKGVVLTHDNVLHCAASIMEAIALGPADAHASWLPLFHDMGLFGTLTGIFTGIPVNLWSPAAFVKDPARWLTEFAATGSTISTMPNFAFDALVDAVPPERARELDLSAWRVCFNGAEIIRADSLAAFAERFAPAGFRPATMTPGFGMAEATLVATLPPLGRGPVVEAVDREALAATGHARPATGAAAREVVGLGVAVPGMAVRIAGDPPDGTVGEIELRGAAVTAGYRALPAGEQPFTADGWLRTGDLGYLRAGELFFTGRAKEMITVRGVNTYPSDVEVEVAAVPGVRRGRCVAYAELDSPEGERIAVVAETALTDPAERAALVRAITARLHRALALTAPAVHLTEPGAIPRTTSGKLRRLHTAAHLPPSPAQEASPA